MMSLLKEGKNYYLPTLISLFIAGIGIYYLQIPLFGDTREKYINSDNNEENLNLDIVNNIKTEDNIVDLKRNIEWLERMKEHPHCCYDIQAFMPVVIDDIEKNDDKNFMGVENSTFSKLSTPESKTLAAAIPIIYLFLMYLVLSLVQAAFDLSEELAKKNNEKESSRRHSLQDYAFAKHNRRSQRENSGSFQRRSTMLSISSRVGNNLSLDDKRITTTISGSRTPNLITEPNTPAKSSNNLGTRPVPLLRRCSAPVFVHRQIGLTNIIRRPSIESHSEDDSSPDVKRRVRMIHRH